MLQNYGDSDSDVLYIQGPPLPVGSLQSVLISLFTVYSNWSIPYTIMGVDITGYNINITRDNSTVNQSFVTNTEYYYNVSQFGVYNISVAAVIGDELEGEINTVMVEVPEAMINRSSIDILISGSDNRIARCIIRGERLINPLPTRLVLKMTQKTYSTKNITLNGSALMAEIFLTLDSELKFDEHSNATTNLEYKNGVNVTFSETEIKFFNISSSNGLCGRCSFITRNYTQGCFIVYNSTRTIFNGHFNITVSEQQQCVEDIYTSVYNITIYDIENESKQRMAFEIINVSINGMPFIESTSINTVTTTRTTMIMAMTTRPTESYTIASSSTGSIIIIAGVSVPIATTVIVLVLLITILLLVLTKRSNSLREGYPNDKQQPQAESPTHTATEIPLEEQEPLHEEYSRLNHTQGHVLSDTDSNTNTPDIYNRLDRNNQKNKLTFTNGSTAGDYSALQTNGSTVIPDYGYSTLPGLGPAVSRKAELSYSFIKDSVVLVIPHRWEEFGKHLAIKPDLLQEIRENHPHNDTDAFCDVINEWQNTQTRPFIWSTLDMVLTVMRETELLMSIKREKSDTHL